MYSRPHNGVPVGISVWMYLNRSLALIWEGLAPANRREMLEMRRVPCFFMDFQQCRRLHLPRFFIRVTAVESDFGLLERSSHGRTVRSQGQPDKHAAASTPESDDIVTVAPDPILSVTAAQTIDSEQGSWTSFQTSHGGGGSGGGGGGGGGAGLLMHAVPVVPPHLTVREDAAHSFKCIYPFVSCCWALNVIYLLFDSEIHLGYFNSY